MNTKKATTRLTIATTILLAGVMSIGQAAVTTDENSRVTLSAEGPVSQGGAAATGEASRDEYEALVLSGQRVKPARPKVQKKTSGASAPAALAAQPNTDFWIYEADVVLYSDRDVDGYYSGIDLLFDADTYYDVADVYAVLYLSYEYGEWNEYAETETFTIFGTSADDEYVVETDLVQGYPTGNYDILIELYDAWDNAFVASFGPEDTSELSILPLEDANRDSPNTGTTQIVVSSGGGGSVDWFLLLGLAGAVALLRRR